MSVMYYLYQSLRKNSPKKGYWYARVKPSKTMTLKDIADEVQKNASVKKSDVMAVLTELSDVMNNMLAEGHRVKIDGFGTFKVSISSEGVQEKGDYVAAKHIKSSKILFQPDKLRIGQRGTTARYLASTLDFIEVEQPVKNTSTTDSQGE